MNRFSLLNKATSDASDATPPYDALIYSIGYERRSRFVAEKFEGRANVFVGIAFTEQRVESFEENLAWAEQRAHTIEDCCEDEFQRWFENWLGERLEATDTLRLCVDISSMSRLRIANVVSVLAEAPLPGSVRVDFCYAPALYEKPSDDADPVAYHSPISGYFAGWSANPDAPIAAILGIGYEHSRALGAIEYFETNAIWVFRPHGEDSRYDNAVVSVNQQLLSSIQDGRLLEYDILNPHASFSTLEALVYALISTHRPLVVPFGPKIFTLIALLVSAVHHPRVAVWRISSGAVGQAVDHEPSGTITVMKVEVSA